jgi:hypothetical protein
MTTGKIEDPTVGDIWKSRFGHLCMTVQEHDGKLKLLCLRGGHGDKVGKLYPHCVVNYEKVGHFDGI